MQLQECAKRKVDQLYVDVEPGETYFMRGKAFIKLKGSPRAIWTEGHYITFNEHTVVEVESDKILLTKEQFYERFPYLKRVQSC